jgi:hypothetical protein
LNATATLFHVIDILIMNKSPEDSLPMTLFDLRAQWKDQFAARCIARKCQPTQVLD